MIDYIKYTINGKTYSITNKGDNVWEADPKSPSVIGNYNLIFEVSEDGAVSFIDSSNPQYEVYLKLIENIQKTYNIKEYLPYYYSDIEEFNILCEIENEELDNIRHEVDKLKSDRFISTYPPDMLEEVERFFGIKSIGSISQRKRYLKSLFQTGVKLNKSMIEGVVKSITGSDCITVFFGADELNNPEPGTGIIRVQVLSPDTTTDYRYEDIHRSLQLLVPAHLKLMVVKYFATWQDIKNDFDTWESVASLLSTWNDVKSYVSPALEGHTSN